MFEIRTDPIDQMKQAALAEMENHSRLKEEGAAWRKLFRDTIKKLSQTPFGWAGALIAYQKAGIEHSREVYKVSTWIAVTQCSDCGEMDMTASRRPKEERFTCQYCGEFCHSIFVAGAEGREKRAAEVSRVWWDQDQAAQQEGEEE